MAEFVPFDDKVEVSGYILSFRICEKGRFKVAEDTLKNIVKKFLNIDKIEQEKWYPQKKWLEALKFIHENIGPNTIFILGKSITTNEIFPEEIQNLEQALNSIDIAYHQNHRNGEIGYYKLVDFDYSHNVALFECKNPYPDEFDKGILTGVLRKFLPENSLEHSVEIDTTKPYRRQGADSTFYIIKW